jgi:hypothetical protein
MKIIECKTEVTKCPNCGRPVSDNILKDWENEEINCFISKEIDNNGNTLSYNVICLNDSGE